MKDIARHYSLTSHKRDVLPLSEEYAANTIVDELSITYSTSPGYIKNVYSKCFIHSHQDAIDLENMAFVNK